ncbi:MAG: tRNA dihydrouridine(20/20a) synthase DusA [Enterobacterales bacterium]|nr:tRNA dihydrouridine(20/20a) synthase DusA [Enterobacterales bacterium]
MPKQLNRSRFSIAPMMDWTDRHYRYFIRLITQQSLLYSEMVTSGAVLNGDRDKLLAFSPQEGPVVLQLGGSNPKDLAICAKIGEDYGYAEINLNVGCPSDRVQSGKIGACLMADAELVAELLAQMKQAVTIPVTVKHRTGIDDQDSYLFMKEFVQTVMQSACDGFIVHARKAILCGLSPKQNRDVPPLDYPRVYQLKKDLPELSISINGGIKSIQESLLHLAHVDGVMIGREAYHNPFMLAQVDRSIFEQPPRDLTRIQVVEEMLDYIEGYLASGGKLQHISRHMLGLFHAQPNGKLWRRHLSEAASHPDANTKVILDALDRVR